MNIKQCVRAATAVAFHVLFLNFQPAAYAADEDADVFSFFPANVVFEGIHGFGEIWFWLEGEETTEDNLIRGYYDFNFNDDLSELEAEIVVGRPGLPMTIGFSEEHGLYLDAKGLKVPLVAFEDRHPISIAEQECSNRIPDEFGWYAYYYADKVCIDTATAHWSMQINASYKRLSNQLPIISRAQQAWLTHIELQRLLIKEGYGSADDGAKYIGHAARLFRRLHQDHALFLGNLEAVSCSGCW